MKLKRAKDDTPRADKWLRWLKNTWLGAAAAVLFVLLGGLLHAAGYADKARDLYLRARYGDDGTTFQFKNQRIQYDGGNGLFPETAVIITGANTSDAGIAAEYHWMRHFYPDYEVMYQAVRDTREGRAKLYDTFVMRSRATGYEQRVLFDITSWFGRPSSDAEQQRIMERTVMQAVKHPAPERPAP